MAPVVDSIEMITQLRQWIVGGIADMGGTLDQVSIDTPIDAMHGDFTTNCAFVLAKQLGTTPVAAATQLASILAKTQNQYKVSEISVAPQGFINIILQDEVLSAYRALLCSDGYRLSTHCYDGKRIVVEHSSPNLFKPFHVGHMMNNAIGESVVRLMRYSGAQVITVSFPSDVGLGIAKAVWSVLQTDHSLLYDSNMPLPEKMKFLGECYAVGNRAYEEDESVVSEIKKINEEIYLQLDTPAYALYLYTKQLNIQYFEATVDRLGSRFDAYIFESEAGTTGEELVRQRIGVVFNESDGAVIYTPDADTNLPTLVFVTSEGHPTYEAKDLGLLSLKFERYHPDISVFVTDYQQAPHFAVVLDSARHIDPVWADRSVHIPHGRMSFRGQKMSSRLGGVPLATEILETVREEVVARSRQSDDVVYDAIAIAAVKFAILRSKPGQNINFDPDTSLSFEGDSGPYLQYTYARMCSVITRGKTMGIVPQYGAIVASNTQLLERLLFRLPIVILRAQQEYAPQLVVNYALDIAQACNSWYTNQQICDDDTVASAYRLGLCDQVRTVLGICLDCLGIVAPERM